ncbi:unnamed protein product [Cochlearia groenlandica]
MALHRSFSSIEGDFCREPVVARLLHSWEARNFRRGNALMGLELLLIDLKLIRLLAATESVIRNCGSFNRVFVLTILQKAKEKERYCCGGGGGAYYEGGYSGVFEDEPGKQVSKHM